MDLGKERSRQMFTKVNKHLDPSVLRTTENAADLLKPCRREYDLFGYHLLG